MPGSAESSSITTMSKTGYSIAATSTVWVFTSLKYQLMKMAAHSHYHLYSTLEFNSTIDSITATITATIDSITNSTAEAD